MRPERVVDPSKYRVDAAGGRIRGKSAGHACRRALQYTDPVPYIDVSESNRLNNEDDNPMFDGMRVFVQDDPLGLDSRQQRMDRTRTTPT